MVYKNVEETRELVNQLVSPSLFKDTLKDATKDPLNTEILKNKIYPRRLGTPQEYSLTFDESYALGAYLVNLGRKNLVYITDKNVEKVYRSRCLSVACALQAGGLTPVEIAGLCSAVFDHDIKEYVNPDSSPVIDNCGMGGDRVFTPNLSTTALLISSNFGRVKTCKHGSPGNTDSAGSSDFVCYLLKRGIPGIEKEEDVFERVLKKVTSEEMAKIIDDVGFGYTEALDERYKTIHLQTHVLGHVAHLNDILGPVTCPVNPQKMTRRIVGINHLIKTRDVAEAYDIMNRKGITNVERAYFVRGIGTFGMDEFSLFPDGTEVSEIRDGKIKGPYFVTAKDFGTEPIKIENPEIIQKTTLKGRYTIHGISPPIEPNQPSAEKKKELSYKILQNDVSDALRNFVKANISPILVLFDEAKDFKEGFEIAEQLLSEKHGLETANSFVEAVKSCISKK